MNPPLEYAPPRIDSRPPEYELLSGVFGYLWITLVTWIALMFYTGGILDRGTGAVCLATAILLPLLLLLPLAIWRYRRVLTLTLLVTFGATSVLAMAGYALSIVR